MTCPTCDQPATHGWQRQATDQELEAARTDPNNPAVGEHDTTAHIQVLACEQHALHPELAAKVHDADCTAPPACDCSARHK